MCKKTTREGRREGKLKRERKQDMDWMTRNGHGYSEKKLKNGNKKRA